MLRRLALICDHALPSNAQGVNGSAPGVYAAQVGRLFADRGWRTDVFVRRENRRLPTICDRGGGLRVIQVDAGPPAFVAEEHRLALVEEFTARMTQFCRLHGDYDLIHANSCLAGSVAVELKRTFGMPFVVTIHELGQVDGQHQGSADGASRERFDIEKRIMGNADAVIAGCPDDRENRERLYGVSPGRIHVVPYGFDPHEFGPVDRLESRRRLELNPADRVLVYIGRLVPCKGVATAIEGFARLVRKHGIPARMLVVGGETHQFVPRQTSEIGRLAEVARREGVEELVSFTGRRDRRVLRYYYSAAEVFVTTPWYEPFSVTPVEAMACGTPVIGSNVGGIKYAVEHQRTGLLVAPRDAESLGRHLAEFYRQPELRRRMRSAGLARVHSLFTWRRVVSQLDEICEDVLADRTAAPPTSALRSEATMGSM